jgi:hypothetical protein
VGGVEEENRQFGAAVQVQSAFPIWRESPDEARGMRWFSAQRSRVGPVPKLSRRRMKGRPCRSPEADRKGGPTLDRAMQAEDRGDDGAASAWSGLAGGGKEEDGRRGLVSVAPATESAAPRPRRALGRWRRGVAGRCRALRSVAINVGEGAGPARPAVGWCNALGTRWQRAGNGRREFRRALKRRAS